MNSSRRRQINELAKIVLRELELNPPVDVEKAVELLGGQLEPSDPEGGTEAMVEKNGEGFIIRLGSSETRRRFSIAHELGHFFLHMGYLSADDRWRRSENYRDNARFRYGFSEEEYEANEFAGAFLMPEEEFREVAEKYKTAHYHRLQPIADHFGVSCVAVRNRGRFLKLFSWG